MPKLPVIKAKELLRVAHKAGFIKFHQVGSHVQLKHPDGRRITVPNHPSKEIRRGTLRGIITDMQFSVDEFIKLLKR